MLYSGLVLPDPMLSRSKPFPFPPGLACQRRAVSEIMTFPWCLSCKCLSQMFVFTELFHRGSNSVSSNQQRFLTKATIFSSEFYNVDLYPMLSKLRISVLPSYLTVDDCSFPISFSFSPSSLPPLLL